MENIILEFKYNKIHTFGSRDLEHRFLVRNGALKNSTFNKELVDVVNGQYKIEIIATRNHQNWDIDNIFKVFIDSFSLEQITKDLEDYELYKMDKLKSENKIKDFKKLEKNNELNLENSYIPLGIYAKDTLKYISEVTAKGIFDDSISSDIVQMKILKVS